MEEDSLKEESHGLRRNAIGLGTVLMQSIAQIAPALGLLSTFSFNVRLAGLGAPSAYVAAFIVALAVALTLGQLAKFLPSAGGFYTYVSVTLGPVFGFVAGWGYSWFVAAIPGAIASYAGSILSDQLRAHYAMVVPWPVFSLAILMTAAWAAYRGIKISGSALMVLSIVEMSIVAGLAAFGLAQPGPGGFSVLGFDPRSSTSASGFYLAVVFSIFAFTGWEGAAAVAEETRNPRREIPRAIIGSVVLIGIFYAFCAWGLEIGWGVANLDQLERTRENLAFVEANHFWGAGGILTVLAFVNSAIAVCIACAVDATRIWYAMARAHALPRGLNFIHPRYRTPTRAVALQTALATAVALGLGNALGPDQSFFVLGLVGTLVYVVVYCLGNVGVVRYFLTVRRPQFQPMLHVVFPVLSSLILLWIAFNSLSPPPEPPVSYAPLIVVALYGAGLCVLAKLMSRPGSNWKQLSMTIYEE